MRTPPSLSALANWLFVERGIYDEFVGRVAAFGKTLRVGDGRDPATQVGPLVSEEQLKRVTGYLGIGRQEGARPLSGGERLTDGELAKGYFVPPTVFADVRDDMRIAQEEIFGPVISAVPFTDIDEVIERGNRMQFDLGSGVWTRDVGKAHQLAKSIRAGSVWINCYQAMDPAAVRGLQDERIRTRVRHTARGRVPERQVGLDQDRLTPLW